MGVVSVMKIGREGGDDWVSDQMFVIYILPTRISKHFVFLFFE